MKIDRHMGILAILQQKGRVTAPYLAERFEVSRRTINRDIEELCRAGIPIQTVQGAEGGIQLMEGYVLDTTVVTRQERAALAAGLQGLESVGAAPEGWIKEKLGLGQQTPQSIRDHGEESRKDGKKNREEDQQEADLRIDLASFYKGSLSDKIRLLREAIQNRRQVRFRYYYPKGTEKKTIEPYQVIFKWSDWYVLGYSPQRQDFRLYKLVRLWEAEMLESTFIRRELPAEKQQLGSHMKNDLIVEAVYVPEAAYRLVEEYGPESYRVLADGRLYTAWGYSSYERALDWVLGFGSRVEILGPEEFRQLYLAELRRMLQKYEKE